ncbi:WD40-repeat-containing domain protein [Aspergillus arachidicola]|uniref:WD40-repeat-containing domain protein n=1 Tax=Aspergillus arachidicola TaxID=656916 RepID=A0A5N6YJA6_9EURO|nr:WD40-repeat-containing domain protein [Aspergillus arachidicola]
MIWNTTTDSLLYTLPGDRGRIWGQASSPDSKILATHGFTSEIRLWDMATGQEYCNFTGHSKGADMIVFSPDGNSLVSSSGDHTIMIWDIEAKQQVRVLRGHTQQVVSGDISPDGKQIISASFDKTIRAWDMATATSRIVGQHAGSAFCVRYSPDDWNSSWYLARP